jgi:hypothetical protein
MLLVVPISRVDAHLVPTVEKAFSIFPPGSGHSLLVVGSPNARLAVESAMVSLGQYFSTTGFHIFEHDNDLGWPTACNYYWQQTCYHLSSNIARGWMWFELDCTPLKDGWLDTIDAEYDNTTESFMGVYEKTYKGFNGVLQPEEEAGFHMAACGVYQYDIVNLVPTLSATHDTARPWWEFNQWYIIKDLFNTNLIQNNWRTLNYRINDKTEIICDSDANWAWDMHYNNPVSSEAVVLHGCKDGSLAALYADAPKSFCDGLKDMQEGRVVDLDTALHSEPEKARKPVPASYRRKKNRNTHLCEA